ncbi:S-adenosylmethionine:tRNA ribosyltransferase-isomerase [Sulfurimonas gotlandica GD1]|uniref:S-adenosylmethionine:tRNA ribosyltransferase-isomerase n=1 Tax=Sulfurimonas gotlandica (strain DSM 19862 / JCM 16533 / GD1) TaxID=929558 RepID=B6BIN2_SULGG|nr:tRNA preQ1(34) S-adenosylmethionine ribosyltransferase-isomerase QueA [Sulfurimonas gotlandica]EDZ63394.1 S-adenosylmethionine:tRNA ribosyltransferase-isomerase [Sulfurimonas gotlandica GD1]EHP30389.1 S-adenosylmethionine:tRNA ribosyltransferase-isomerase [Sulfurimonas gotlandica GD1]
MNNPELLTSSYDFILPDELIATHPASPRDHAKLLVYNRRTNEIKHCHFYDFEKYIPKDCALIFNDTKVIKARLYGHKLSGGKIELLINKPLDANNINVYIRGKVKDETKILFDEDLEAVVLKLNDDGSRVVNFFQKNKLLRFEDILPIIDRIGHIPLPPYIQREDNAEDASEYQSVFARQEGAVAAPTASLHFTEEQHERVCKNHDHAFITLHVGSGTFKPVEAQTITDHPMHSEYYEISNKAKELLDSDKPILSIGTTSTRTVEFYARHKEMQRGEANLFLHPNNKPIRVNYLLTNFHLPKSTLLMLVASFVGVEKAQQLYANAIKNNYRFYSYGDAMLIL